MIDDMIRSQIMTKDPALSVSPARNPTRAITVCRWGLCTT
jgi:hypothetical protein